MGGRNLLTMAVETNDREYSGRTLATIIQQPTPVTTGSLAARLSLARASAYHDKDCDRLQSLHHPDSLSAAADVAPYFLGRNADGTEVYLAGIA